MTKANQLLLLECNRLNGELAALRKVNGELVSALASAGILRSKEMIGD